jgi:uncharacterized protein (TIGR02099 family)
MINFLKSQFDASKFLRVIFYSLAGTLITIVFLSQVVLRYVIWPQVEIRKDQISHLMSNKLGIRVSIGKVKANWEYLRPGFEIENLTFDQANSSTGHTETLLKVPHAEGIIGWDSFLTGKPHFFYLRAKDIEVTASRDANGIWTYAGVTSSLVDSNKVLMKWVLGQRNLSTKNVHVSVKDNFEGAQNSEFTIEEFSLWNRGTNHTIELKTFVTPSQGLIDFEGEFDHRRFSSASNWRNWVGSFKWKIEKVNLANFLKIIKFSVKSGSGQIDLHGQTSLDQGIFKHSDLFLEANQIDVDWINTRSKLQLNHAHIELDQTSEGAVQTVVANKIDWQLKGDEKNTVHTLKDLRVLFTPNLSNKRWGELEIQSSIVSVREIADLVKSMPIPDHTLEIIQTLNPEGVIENLRLNFLSGSKDKIFSFLSQSHTQLQAQGSLKEVGWQAYGHNIPGVIGLSGELQSSEEKGTFQLTSDHLKLLSTKLFSAKQVNLSGISGQASWQKKANQWQIETKNLEIKNEDVNLKANLKYLTPDKKDADQLDLDVSVLKIDASQVLSVIPANVAKETTRYLRETISGGIVEDSSFSIHGDTHHIPYSKKNSGEFNLDLNIKNATYRPIPSNSKVKGEWPSFENVNAHVTMKNNLLRVEAPIGTYKGVQLKDVHVSMDIAQKPGHLFIKGLASGPATDFVNYLSATPVAVKYQQELKALSFSGNANLDLNIDQTFGEKSHTGLLMKIDFDKNQIRFGKHPPGQVNKGSVTIDDTGIKDADIVGNFLGGPVSIKNNSSRTDEIDITGNVDSDQLFGLIFAHQNLNEQLLKNTFTGKMGFNGTIIRKPNNSLMNLNIDLRSTNINLPEPFLKKANEPLLGTLRFERSHLENVSLSDWQLKVGSLIQTNGHLKNNRLDRLSVAVGNAQLPTNQQNASLAFDVDTFDLDSWLKFFEDFKTNHPKYFQADATSIPNNSPTLPMSVTGKVKNLMVLNRRFKDINFQAKQLNQDWEGTLISPTINGNMSWINVSPDSPFGALKMNFSQLNIPHPNQPQAVNTESKSRSGLEHLPSMEVKIDSLSFGESKLGSLDLQTIGGNEVWVIDHLQIKNKSGTVNGKGRWELPKGNDQGKTSIKFDVDTKNAAELISGLGIKENVLSGGEGNVHGELNWQGAPVDFNTVSLNGDLQMELKNGSILQVDPGAAKLLGILSLQSLFKFATLNFKGSLGETVTSGTPFDKISATANVRRGNIRNNDFEMQSTLAKITARGSINLNRETQDLRITIYPRINFGSAGLAAFYFVTPIIGFTALVGQYLFSSGINKALQSDLLIQGSWQNPEVIPLDQNGQPLDPEVLNTIRRKGLLKEPPKKLPPSPPETSQGSNPTP